ncbi:hypothetical protein HELRODRAFT_160806 [Helobdella robusta]|uniref:Apple domain-containing protein n=1 Tax=Helobdella robusta TaxID=6412 RepID=T1EQR0_HELRO|nr:hypothetical protein HELRODRAFT_160806 [Helobdella robusta]ESO06616.1 hypothetical protein HELRODRAFT_160806 [Helobdella robusta]
MDSLMNGGTFRLEYVSMVEDCMKRCTEHADECNYFLFRAVYDQCFLQVNSSSAFAFEDDGSSDIYMKTECSKNMERQKRVESIPSWYASAGKTEPPPDINNKELSVGPQATPPVINLEITEQKNITKNLSKVVSNKVCWEKFKNKAVDLLMQRHDFKLVKVKNVKKCRKKCLKFGRQCQHFVFIGLFDYCYIEIEGGYTIVLEEMFSSEVHRRQKCK